jgi:DNA-directed RNA polymerase subunit RPC12/RpoP
MSDERNPIVLSALREEKLVDERGIACPKCGCRDWRVRNTVPQADSIHRYRLCRNCGHTRRTVEKAG